MIIYPKITVDREAAAALRSWPYRPLCSPLPFTVGMVCLFSPLLPTLTVGLSVLALQTLAETRQSCTVGCRLRLCNLTEPLDRECVCRMALC